jgi:hypothetical protein
MGFVQSWDYFEKECTLYIEDDDDVAYGYFFIERKISSVVWLYNLSLTPEKPVWETAENYGKPCKISSFYVGETILAPLKPPEDFIVLLTTASDSSYQIEIGIQTYFGKKLLAVLRQGEKIGWCMNVKKDSPIAKSLKLSLQEGLYVCNFWNDKVTEIQTENINDNDNDDINRSYYFLEMTS